MRLTKLLSDRLIEVPIKKKIDWNKAVSKPQKETKDFLFPYWKYDRVVEEFRIPGSLLRIDLFNTSKRIAIEVSPDEYHVEYNEWLHKDRSKFLAKKKGEEDKRGWCNKNNIKLIELYNSDLKDLSVKNIETKFGISL